MAFNLRKFNTEADYTAATPTLNYPSVAWVTGNDSFHYDKTEPTPPEPAYGGLTVKYYIADPSVEVTLFNGGGGASSSSSGSGSGSGSGGGAMPTTMIVDGVEETPINTWRFETDGEHIVQYAFADNVINVSFYDINEITEVVVGDDITEIATLNNNGVFSQCTGITSATIGSGITYIGASAFAMCTSLTSVTINAITPPQLEGNTFTTNSNYPIYVPASAVETYQTSTSTGWSEYASRIEAIQ